MRHTFFLRASAIACVAFLLMLAVAGLMGTGAAATSSKKQKGGGDDPKKQYSPTEGSLRVLDAKGQPTGLCPLKHTNVRAEISGLLARVNVTQEFENPFDEKIEAVYVFPLPQSAAVDEMTMRVGERTVKGKIMRREEARATYEAARQRGQVASLLDQERPNIFTQSVANIVPGARVTISISYVETLKYEEGSYEWSFPMMVGERYIPASEAQTPPATDDNSEPRSAMPDAALAQINPARVPKGMRAGHDVSVEVAIDAGVPVGAISSATHEIEVARTDERRAVARLKDESVIPNKDFTLRYEVAGSRIEDAVLAHRDARGGFFTLILQPPERVTVEDVTPKELVFVLDTSGSMEGFPIEKAKETMRLALDGLYPQDTFNLITFSGDTSVLFPEPVPATPENLRAAKKFLSSRKGEGGTEMMKAIRAALDPSDAQGRVRVVCFMTDGQVGDDMEIISEVQKHPNARVFAMGFGDDPNRFLLDKMAEYGRGEVEYVTEHDDGNATARRFHRRVREPLLTDISVEFEELTVEDVYPKRIPDLFSAKPVVLAGRYARGGEGTIRLKGRMSGREFVREIPVALPDAESAHDVLATLWARRRVDDLMGQDMAGIQQGQTRDDVRREITQLGLDFGLMTQFTSFIAVDETSATGEGEPRRVEVPAESAQPNAVNNSSIASAGMLPATATYTGPVGVTGGVAETVTVMAGADITDTTSASLSTTVETRSISELPVNGRNVLSLAVLAPGSAPNGASQPRTAGPDHLAVNGQRPSSNSFVIDGVSVNPTGGAGVNSSMASPGTTAYGGVTGLVSLDGVQELSVDTRSTSAEYGRNTGAVVNVTTRAGTNEFHGSIYEYFGNEALDANDWFANSRAARRGEHRQNLFGGTLGGPARRDRAFFFLTYEGLRLREPHFAITDVPSSDARLNSPAALRPFLSAFPLPTDIARTDDFAESSAAYSNPARSDSGSFRFDLNASPTLQLNARYAVSASSTEARGAGYSLNTINRLTDHAQTLTSGLSHTFSSTVAGELRAGYSRFTLRGSRRLDGFGGALVPADLAALTTGFIPRGELFSFDLDGRSAALSFGDDGADVRRQINLVSSITAIHETHTFKFGADYARLFPVLRPPLAEFDALFNGPSEAVNGLASRQSLYARAGARWPVFNQLGAYAQDEWRLIPRLTLSYGLRWELSAPPSLRAGDEPLAVSEVSDPARVALAERGTPLWSKAYGNFAPHVGVAYLLSKADGRELIARGGFGVFYDLSGAQSVEAFGDNFPLVAARTIFDTPFPQLTGVGILPVSSAATQGGVPLVAFDPHLRLPYTLRWNMSVEREFGHQTVSAAYVGASGRRLLLTQTLLDQSTDFPLLRLTTNGASSRYDALQIEFNRRFTRGLSAAFNYTWSKSIDDAPQDSLARALLRGDAPGQERAASDFDVRHLLAGHVSYDLPTPFSSGFGRVLLRRWTLNAIFDARSARPVNVLYAVPTPYGFAYLRPDLVGGSPLYLRDADAAGGWRINSAAFIVPAAMRQGTLGRNSLRGFAFNQLDLALLRRFNFNERVSMQLGVEAFNLLNHPNFEDPSGADVVLSGRLSPAGIFRPNLAFGSSNSTLGGGTYPTEGYQSLINAGGARTVQLSLKLSF